MEKINNHWVDSNNNKWDCRLYKEEEAEKYSNTLINCIDCRDCSYCRGCSDCSNCRDCSYCPNCNKSGCLMDLEKEEEKQWLIIK